MQLAAELRADRASRAGDKDATPCEMPGDRGDVGPDRPAAEQVADPRIANAFYPGASADQLGRGGDHLGDQPAPFGAGREVTEGRPCCSGDGYHQNGGAGRGGRLGHPRPVAKNGHPVHPQPALGRVVVEQRDRPVRGTRLVQQAADQRGARVPRPEYDDLDPGRRLPAAPPRTALSRGEHHVPRHDEGGQRDGRGAEQGLQHVALPAKQHAAEHRERHEHQRARDEHADHLIEAAPRMASPVEAGQQPGQHGQHAHGKAHHDKPGRPGFDVGHVPGEPADVAQPRQPHDRVVTSLGAGPDKASRAACKPLPGLRGPHFRPQHVGVDRLCVHAPPPRRRTGSRHPPTRTCGIASEAGYYTE